MRKPPVSTMVMNGRALPKLSVPPSGFRDCTSPSTGDLTVLSAVLAFSFSMSFFLVAMLAFVSSTFTFCSRRSRAYCRLVASS